MAEWDSWADARKPYLTNFSGSPEEVARLEAAAAKDFAASSPDAWDKWADAKAEYETRRKADVAAMSGTEQFTAAAGKGMKEALTGWTQSPEEVRAAKRQDAALLATGPGFAGNVAGNVAAMLPLAVVPGANTLLGALGYGALSGAMQPAESGLERGENAMWGGGVSGAMTAAMRALPFLKRTIIDPLRAVGRDDMVVNVLRRFADDPNALLTAQTSQLLPGSGRTLAEATGDPGIAQLQRSAQAASPEVANELWKLQVARNQARVSAIRDIAKTPQELAAAEQARRVAVNPLYSQAKESEQLVDTTRVASLIDRIVRDNPKREAVTSQLGRVRESLFEPYPVEARGADGWAFVRDLIDNRPRMSGADYNALLEVRKITSQVKNGKITAADAFDQLKGVSTSSGAATDAVNYVRDLMRSPDYVLSSDVKSLASASKNIGDLIDLKGPTGARVNEAIVRELVIVKKALDNAIGRAEPAYRAANAAFRDLSKPIDQMKVGQTILDKATSALPKSAGEVAVYPEAFAKALRGDEATVRAATGFKRNAGLESVLTPEQMGTLGKITADLASEVQAANAGAVRGSQTAQHLARSNIMRNVLGPLGLPQSWADALVADLTTNRAFDWALKPLEARIQERLAKMLIDPQLARDAVASQARREAFFKPAAAIAQRAVPALSLGAGGYVAQQ